MTILLVTNSYLRNMGFDPRLLTEFGNSHGMPIQINPKRNTEREQQKAKEVKNAIEYRKGRIEHFSNLAKTKTPLFED